MLRASLVLLLLAPASALYWLEDTNATSASELMSTGNWAHCLTTLDIPDRSL